MAVKLIGPHPFECDATGKQRTRIGTVFPYRRTLITLPGIHATQRVEFIDRLNAARGARGEPPLTEPEIEEEYARSVDLIFDAHRILIRPDPDNMPLAFEADELLQELVSKQKIRYLMLSDVRVRQAINHVLHQMETVKVVLHPHVEGRRDCAFFLIAANMQVVVGAAIGQTMNH